MTVRLLLSLIAGLLFIVPSVVLALDLVLPTDNKGLLEGKPDEFYQFVDRTQNGEKTTPWEAGQFGLVRDAMTLTTGETIFTRFHEGMDIKPMHRDAKDEPTDEVRSIGAGEVVYVSAVAGHSNYGKYIVIKHDWGEGAFYSLYAHLNEIKCEAGQKVQPGSTIAIMGHTGVGLDRRRAHVHVELNLFLSSHFAEWHDGTASTPNYHGNWNGLNLVGLDIGALFLAHAKNHDLSVAGLVKQTEPYFRVAVPGLAEMELVKNYPWLCPSGVPTTAPQSWQITLSNWGLPIKVEPGTEAVSEPTVVWVKPSKSPHYSLSRHLLNGSGAVAKLSNDGESYVRLIAGLEHVHKATGSGSATASTARKKKK